MDKKKIFIFDTTLRDGEQCPGASLNVSQKIEMAHQLIALGVDAIEAGFPVSSPGDFEAVSKVSKISKKVVVCGLARCMEKDIKAAASALRNAARPRIHVFLATSKIHMQYKLKKAEDEIVKLAAWGVKFARKFTDDVEFSPEDASRTEPRFLYRVLDTVIAEGARTVNIPDTVGYAIPERFGALIKGIRDNVCGIEDVVISVHCHNDLGLAVANSLSAIRNGARQVECTINGLGERAGNASLEEIVMALKPRKVYFGDVHTTVDTRQIYPASRLVSKLTGIPVQPNKAIVGIYAFSNESGIHQDVVLKKRQTYEIISPQQVGFGASRIVLGKHSGRHAFKLRLQKLGYRLNERQLEKAFEDFKVLADKKKEVFDNDIQAIVEGEIAKIPDIWSLEYIHITSGTNIVPTATVRLRHKKGTVMQKAGSGDGPVDASYKAMEAIIGIKTKLLEYSINSVTQGKDALGKVRVKLSLDGRVIFGDADSTDIIEASAKAYLNAINRYLIQQKRA